MVPSVFSMSPSPSCLYVVDDLLVAVGAVARVGRCRSRMSIATPGAEVSTWTSLTVRGVPRSISTPMPGLGCRSSACVKPCGLPGGVLVVVDRELAASPVVVAVARRRVDDPDHVGGQRDLLRRRRVAAAAAVVAGGRSPAGGLFACVVSAGLALPELLIARMPKTRPMSAMTTSARDPEDDLAGAADRLGRACALGEAQRADVLVLVVGGVQPGQLGGERVGLGRRRPACPAGPWSGRRGTPGRRRGSAAARRCRRCVADRRRAARTRPTSACGQWPVSAK